MFVVVIGKRNVLRIPCRIIVNLKSLTAAGKAVQLEFWDTVGVNHRAFKGDSTRPVRDRQLDHSSIS